VLSALCARPEQQSGLRVTATFKLHVYVVVMWISTL